MFKITRHFQVSKVLFETVHRVWKQILPMIALLVFLTIVFAIILFQLETGEECFVGDPGCVPPESVANIVREGDRLLINKEGEITQFGDVFDGLWFSFVTMTTVG